MASRTDLFGLDGEEGKTGLPGISDRLLEAATPHQSVPSRRDETILNRMARIGVVQRRQREAGSWVIDEDPLGEGDGWQDWPAFHRVATTRQARIRFLVTSPGAPATERAEKRRLAEHEFRIMSRLPNERLLRPEDMVENDLGVGLVYPVDERFQRLDLWLADQAGRIPLADQLSLLRQVAEAVSYAHQNRVVHRGLTPHAALVRVLTDGGVRVLVGDWQSAGTVTGPALTGISSGGVTGLLGAEENQTNSPERAGVAARPLGAMPASSPPSVASHRRASASQSTGPASLPLRDCKVASLAMCSSSRAVGARPWRRSHARASSRSFSCTWRVRVE
jgi:serine/threonine protein kinase